MLAEIRIENLAVIPRAELVLSPGLNVITGETGAGKTILAHAISLLLGTRADTGLIRPGAEEASVEAVFTIQPGLFADLADEFDVPEDEELIVRRRLTRDGRSRAYMNGHTTTLTILGQITGRLLAFSAQHEQRRLMMSSRQLDIIDDYAGEELASLLDEYRLGFDRRGELAARLAELDAGSEAQEREAELLRFQLAEIEAAGLQPAEDEELEMERRRLLAAGELRESSAGLAALLSGGAGEAAGGSEGIMDALATSLARLETAAESDPELKRIADNLAKNFYELEETAADARTYSESVQVDPERLAEVEERLDLIAQLKRKYGGSIDAVAEYELQSSKRLSSLTGDIEGRPALEKELGELEHELLEFAFKIREQRRAGAESLQQDASRHLSDLAFQDCGFEIKLIQNEKRGEDRSEVSDTGELTAAALTRSGAESAEFLVRLNPGMPASPLKETASGGELSRIMLAIKSAVSSTRETATLVFDEIDAGIGGETGGAVGAKLKGLAAGSQLICITHLPQIASFADAHFSVVKRSDSGKGRESTATEVVRVSEDGIVDELCRMMGSRPDDREARAHATSLLDRSLRNAQNSKTNTAHSRRHSRHSSTTIRKKVKA